MQISWCYVVDVLVKNRYNIIQLFAHAKQDQLL